jgi:nitrite reductase (NADH) small subunit
MAAVDVCSIDDLSEGIPRIVRVSGRDVALTRRGDEVFAVRNVCPHKTHSFHGGQIEKQVTGTGVPDQPLVWDDEFVIVCPWHHWRFNVRSGVCSADSALRVRTYGVWVEGERVLVDIATKAETRSREGSSAR